MTAPRSLLLLALLALGGCPPPTQADAGPPPPDAGPDADAGAPDAGQPAADAGLTAVAIEDWCATAALAQCARDVRCLRVGAARFADCLERRADGCDQASYSSAVRGGRLQYLSAQAAACLNDYAWGSCEEPPAACAQVFTGLVEPDGGCLLAEECSGAGFCSLFDGLCPHRCRPWTPRGASCDWAAARCDAATDTCELDGGAYQCQAFGVEGDACGGYSACRADLTCAAGQCVRREAGPGEACGLTQGWPTCGAEYFCRQAYSPTGAPPPGVCERRSGLGGTCAGWGDCLPSLRCSNEITTGTCLPKGAPDAGCSSASDCEDGLSCSGATLRCAPLPRDGGDCGSQGSFYRCAVGYLCAYASSSSSWTCEARRALGGPCTYDAQCQTQQCDWGTLDDGGYGGRCGPPCSQRADGGQ